MKTLIAVVLMVALPLSMAFGAGTKTIETESSEEIVAYNEGVELMLDKAFPDAERKFRTALSLRERFAEAHNNLAYVLRKQGPDHFEEALTHYNRAIALKPDLPQPYMYRGVLFVQMGEKELAKKDHARLLDLDGDLAEELEYVLQNGREKTPERFFGVSRKLEE